MALLYYLVAILGLLYWYFTRNFNHWKDKNVPFVKPLPIIGNMLNGVLMRLSFGEIFSELYQKTKKPILGFFIFDKPCLLIRDPQIIKRILITDFQYFYDRNILNNQRDDPISTNMLFILKNPEWKEVRSKITPVYSSAKIKGMSALIEHSASEMKNYLSKEVFKNSVIDMKEVSMKYTVNIITSTAFGVEANCFNDEKSRFFVEAKRMIDWDDFMTSFRIRCYFLAHTLVKTVRMKLINPISLDFLSNSFWSIMNQREASRIHRNDLIDILLQIKNDEKNLLDGDMFVSQALIFFVAGFETSSSTMGFALHELAHHPEIQSKMRKEITEVSKKFGGINYDSVKEMEYLDMCIQETLRKYPVVPALERKSNTQYTIPEAGTVLDKDTAVFIPSLSLHYDPQYFPNPEQFDPERFSKENKHLIQNFSYLPFGEGPRNCIGARFGKLTVRIGLANIIQNFVLEPCSEAPEKIKFNPKAFVLSALNGVKLKVIRIED